MSDIVAEEDFGGEFNETPEELEFEQRAQEGALWTGGRLFVGIWMFAFASLAFAYFYLRSANNEGLWRPSGITAPTGLGAAVFAFTLAASLLSYIGYRRFRRDLSLDWAVSGWLAIFCGLVAVGLQIWQLTQLPFFPGSSGYASCFIGWASINIAVLLCGIYWLETVLARELRLRKQLAADGGVTRSQHGSARLFRANLEACSFFWGFIAFVALFFWVLFYVL